MIDSTVRAIAETPLLWEGAGGGGVEPKRLSTKKQVQHKGVGAKEQGRHLATAGLNYLSRGQGVCRGTGAWGEAETTGARRGATGQGG